MDNRLFTVNLLFYKEKLFFGLLKKKTPQTANIYSTFFSLVRFGFIFNNSKLGLHLYYLCFHWNMILLNV